MYAASSREALKGTRAELETALRGADSASVAATTGDELLSVADLLDGERTLRSALADVATPPRSRAAVATNLLEGKVGDPTRSVVAAAASGTWSSADDLVAGVHKVGREALLASAKEKGELDTVEDELFRLSRIIKGNPQLEQSLSDRGRSTADRVGLLSSLIDGKVNPVTNRLATQAIARLEGAPGDVVDELSKEAAAASDREVAYVRAATELTAQQREQLAQKLSQTYGKPVTLHVEIDPDLLGGVVVRVGDEQIDGSIAGRFAALRRGLR